MGTGEGFRRGVCNLMKNMRGGVVVRNTPYKYPIQIRDIKRVFVTFSKDNVCQVFIDK